MPGARRFVSVASPLGQRLRWFLALCCVLATPLLSGAGPFTVYGPVTFARGPGLRGALPSTTFPVKNPSAVYTIRVTRVLGAEPLISINDMPVVGPTDFPEGQDTILRPVTLLAANSIEVVVVGQAGAQATVGIIGDDTDAPVIVGARSPDPNAAGWNSSDVAVTFICTDETSNIVNCSPPTSVTTEGANQVVNGSATDQGGNTANTSVQVSLDKTAPTFTWTSPADGSTFSTPNITATATVADALSGVASATCNGQPATISAGALSCPVTLSPGPNTIVGSVTDVAGNTTTQNLSVTLATTLTVTDFNPKTASIGTLVSMSGAGFASTAVVTLNKQGGASTDGKSGPGTSPRGAISLSTFTMTSCSRRS